MPGATYRYRTAKTLPSTTCPIVIVKSRTLTCVGVRGTGKFTKLHHLEKRKLCGWNSGRRSDRSTVEECESLWSSLSSKHCFMDRMGGFSYVDLQPNGPQGQYSSSLWTGTVHAGESTPVQDSPSELEEWNSYDYTVEMTGQSSFVWHTLVVCLSLIGERGFLRAPGEKLYCRPVQVLGCRPATT